MSIYCTKGFFIQAVNYSHARNNLKSIIDDVHDNDEAYIVTTKHGKTVMIMSLEEYSRNHDKLKKDVKTSLGLNEAFQRAKLAYYI